MLDLAFVFFLLGLVAGLGEVGDVEIWPKTLESHVERPTLVDHVRDLAARHFACAIGRGQAHAQHHAGPFHVVVAALGRLAKLLLFEVGHLMHQRPQHSLDVAVHRVGVQGDLVRVVAIAVLELLGVEVAIGTSAAGQGEHHGRQALVEQFLVEPVERLFEANVGFFGGGLIVGHLILHL